MEKVSHLLEAQNSKFKRYLDRWRFSSVGTEKIVAAVDGTVGTL